MATNAGKSWSAIASQGLPPTGQQRHISTNTTSSTNTAAPAPDGSSKTTHQHPPRQKRSPSPSHKPKTESPEDHVYVLTLATDKRHHTSLTQLRNQYFPKKINKLAAHLTLFHALPGTKLETSIIPHIEAVCSTTQPFAVHAAKPFRLKKGIAISVPKSEGGDAAKEVHRRLQQKWLGEGWLSEQDASPNVRVHYTIMNKVDHEGEVAKAMREVEGSWKGDWGEVGGVGLYRYDRGFWRFERVFGFGGGEGGQGEGE